MLTKVLALVLVVLIGLALGIETARYVHAHATGVDVSGAVNIHHALGFGLLATSGALLLSLSREWFSRQWTRFTVWFELTLDGLFDFDAPAAQCDGYDGPCESMEAKERKCRTAYNWDGAGQNPNRTPMLCDECAQAYDEYWNEMWAQAR